jgi:alpha-L-rhamnosidase
VEKAVASARLYATALGVYECEINGRRVGDIELAPGWTDYAKRVQYQTYDVTDLLQNGDNALGAILGDGWYCGRLNFNPRQNYGDRPKFLAQLEMTFEDGSRQTIETNGSWTYAFGPILENDCLKAKRMMRAAKSQAGVQSTSTVLRSGCQCRLSPIPVSKSPLRSGLRCARLRN